MHLCSVKRRRTPKGKLNHFYLKLKLRKNINFAIFIFDFNDKKTSLKRVKAGGVHFLVHVLERIVSQKDAGGIICLDVRRTLLVERKAVRRALKELVEELNGKVSEEFVAHDQIEGIRNVTFHETVGVLREIVGREHG